VTVTIDSETRTPRYRPASAGAPRASHCPGKEACLARSEVKPLRGMKLYDWKRRVSNRDASADGKIRPGSGHPRDVEEEEEQSMTASTTPSRTALVPLCGART
jgi:hypothetical protein